jgi:ligand-binding sensor domain-containing protein/serine phosphatase RsbU (regulator of sigma subunit)
MWLSNKLKITAGAICCLFLISVPAHGQSYNFRTYGADRKIPNLFIYTIDQTNDGYLWVGTGNGIARFDGFEFFSVAYPDSVSGRYPTASVKDRKGVLWYGFSDGTVFYARDRKLFKVDIVNTKSISEITIGPDSLIYVITQGKSVYSVNPSIPSEISSYSLPSEPVVFSGCFSSSGELLLGTQENILVCSLRTDSLKILSVVEGFDYSAVTSIQPAEDASRFVVGTDGNGIFSLTFKGGSYTLEKVNGFSDKSLSVQKIEKDAAGDYLAATYGAGVIQFSLSDDYKSVRNLRVYDLSTGLNNNDVKSVFQDVQGNYWFGTFGNGLSLLTSYAFSFVAPGKKSTENNIIYVAGYQGKYLLGTPTGFHLFNPEKGVSESFTVLTGNVGNSEITSYYLDSGHKLWIGTAGTGVYVRDSNGKIRQFYRSGDSGADNIRDLKTDDRNLWLATINGVIVLNKETGNRIRSYDISSGLTHSSINSILIDRKDKVFVGNNEGERLFMIDRDYEIMTGKGAMIGSTVNRIQAFSQSRDGSIWISTRGNGVFKFSNDSISQIERSSELLSNYCYSIIADSENNVWVGHEKGFSRINTTTGSISTFGTEYTKGGLCNPSGMFETGDNKILIGTTEGLVIYDRKKDNMSAVPPFTNLNYISINDIRYDYQPVYTLPYKKYIIRLNFVGINFNDPEKVYYSTYIEDFDETWSKFSSTREIPYSLGDGKYKVSIISVNQDGESQKDPLSFIILIKKPWWRTWWAIFTWLAILSAAVVIIIKIREESQKKVQEYLETELEARTSEVVKQKGEIELQNLEITDSINYAKRIQTSILPEFSKLRESFRDAFLFFQPRDIVSGDFYWFDRIGDDKFILVCADSTGHGVPGAFMSMIGSTLLQDIVSRQHVSKPSEILTLLDKQIFATLNQNIELGVSNDGMDMVVCEFNLKKRHIRFASAMRPVIIVIGGESFYIKGNRSAVGGESVMEKYFDDQEYYLNEGDTIYLFSDGLPDQFGGADGKKLKIARLKRIIEQVSDKPMSEQKEIITKFFNDWRGTYEQVDDILLIGVKV